MSTNTFSPTTEDGQLVWLSHYDLKLPIDDPICGIVAEEITDTLLDIKVLDLDAAILASRHPARRQGSHFPQATDDRQYG